MKCKSLTNKILLLFIIFMLYFTPTQCGILNNSDNEYKPSGPGGPIINITFAGNLSEKGGPYDVPYTFGGSLLADAGYYANDSMQSENWIYINCSVNDTDGVDGVWLHWLNGTIWTNDTYQFINTQGNYWEFNTSNNITTYNNERCSFDIWANDTLGNANLTFWNKSMLSYNTRRYVWLNSTPENISYRPLYFYFVPYSFPIAYDGFHHDQGSGATLDDTGFLLFDNPNESVQEVHCGGAIAYWFEPQVCPQPFSLKNIYYHFWSSNGTGSPSSLRFGWSHSRGIWHSGLNNSKYITTNLTEIYYNNGGENNFTLHGGLLNVTPNYNFTDNNIYEFFNHISINEISVISNRSFPSFIIFNVPSNESLQTNDSDNDNLNDWVELYQTYTSPFLNDTDNDSINDYWEYLSGSDPNNYTETYNVSKPEFSNEYPSNDSTEIYHDSVSTSINVSLPYFSGENNYTGFNDTEGYSIYYTPLNMLKGQKFRVSDNFTFYNVNVYGYVPYENYTLTTELYLADVDGFPTGDILSIGNTSTSGWERSSGTADWFSIYMTPYNMTENTDYVIVFNSSETGSTENFFLGRSLSNPYANGFAIRYQFGVWNKLASIDYFFTIRGTNGTYVNISFLSNISGDWKEYGKLYIGENKNCTIYINNLTFENQIYYWIVNASYNYVKENFSEFIYNTSGIYYFIMYDNMSQFISIDDGINGTTVYNATPTFVWSKLVNAVQYWLQIANDSSFTNLVINISNVNRENYPSECTETTRKILFTIPGSDELMLYQTYYCRVKAYIKGEET